jgi:hypothetical protein
MDMFDSGVARAILGGWQISGIFRAASGDFGSIGQGSSVQDSRADYVGGEKVLDNYRNTLQYLNPAAFAPVPINPVSGATERNGTAARGVWRGPGAWTLDFSFGKGFRVAENVEFRIRADLLNATNHANFGNPVTNINSGSFGQIRGADSMRQIQLNARLTF